MVVTLMTAGLCGLLYFWLSFRVVEVRRSAQVLIGDGGDELLLSRIRAHANFAEYVPICLVLIAVIELSDSVSPPGLYAAGIGLVVARVAHAVGMERGGANRWRLAGTVATWTTLVGLSFWAMVRAVTY
ncbi:MAPEG family protein [Sandarakinorhabdus sp. DWP1-3-1]|uniref:MAPEG family protein n=1 Tax=Sandarakinorhabdus sp. DWP1-3-1 TaxID=2804627 RepID=UPI003CEF54F2